MASAHRMSVTPQHDTAWLTRSGAIAATAIE
jgi:hypothetical protein